MTNRSAIAVAPAISDTEQPAGAKIIDFEVASWLREVSVSTSGETHTLLDTILVAASATALRPRIEGPTGGDASTNAEIRLRRILDFFESTHDDKNDLQLSRVIEELLQQYGDSAVEALRRLYLSRGALPLVLSELLAWFGRTDSVSTHLNRFWLLVRCLSDRDPSIRSGAALGLAALEDANAVSYLQSQARTETVSLLRLRLEKVARELDAQADESLT